MSAEREAVDSYLRQLSDRGEHIPPAIAKSLDTLCRAERDAGRREAFILGYVRAKKALLYEVTGFTAFPSERDEFALEAATQYDQFMTLEARLAGGSAP